MEGVTLIAQLATRCGSSLRANGGRRARCGRHMLAALALFLSVAIDFVGDRRGAARADDIQVAATTSHDPIAVAAA